MCTVKFSASLLIWNQSLSTTINFDKINFYLYFHIFFVFSIFPIHVYMFMGINILKGQARVATNGTRTTISLDESLWRQVKFEFNCRILFLLEFARRNCFNWYKSIEDERIFIFKHTMFSVVCLAVQWSMSQMVIVKFVFSAYLFSFPYFSKFKHRKRMNEKLICSC